MICPNGTAPININETKYKKNKCDMKCEYSFNYSYTNIIAKNKGDYLQYSFDPSPTPPVVYNSKNYNVGKMRIYQPSLHEWNGNNADAEIVIEHMSVDGTENLMVCIPVLSKTGVVNDALENILKEVFGTANSEGRETNIKLPTFTLNQIALFKPYYNYTGTLLYSPCNGNYNYVVYSIKDALLIHGKTLDNLKNIIRENTYETIDMDDNDVYYNKDGPTSLKNGEDNIYIECNPTGTDGDNEMVIEKKERSIDTIGNQLLQNTLFKAIMGAIVFIVIVVLFSYLVNKLFSSSNSNDITN